MSSRGEPMLLYNQFTYNKKYHAKRETYIKWCCSSRNSRHCKVNCITDLNNKVLHINVKVVTAVDGATLLMLNGFSFSNPSPMPGGERWYCSGRIRFDCTVCLHVNDDYELVSISYEHTHLPPVYEQNSDLDENVDIETLIAYNESLNNEEGSDDGDEDVVEDDEADDGNVALFVQSRRGHTILQYNGHRYRKTYKSRHGVRWNCSANKRCTAFLYLNDDDEITMENKVHRHDQPMSEKIDADQNDTALIITSRKGKEMLLFRKYTYRKQYTKPDRSRWVCSTLKNCRGCVFTDDTNYITSVFEEHCHSPPKYYLKPDHVLEALRGPVVNT